LVVDIAFAPARPLAFLRVRLVQTKEHGFRLEAS
jgi:hypothetical protein